MLILNAVMRSSSNVSSFNVDPWDVMNWFNAEMPIKEAPLLSPCPPPPPAPAMLSKMLAGNSNI